MYIYHNRNETMNALDGCVGECGTCMEGELAFLMKSHGVYVGFTSMHISS